MADPPRYNAFAQYDATKAQHAAGQMSLADKAVSHVSATIIKKVTTRKKALEYVDALRKRIEAPENVLKVYEVPNTNPKLVLDRKGLDAVKKKLERVVYAEDEKPKSPGGGPTRLSPRNVAKLPPGPKPGMAPLLSAARSAAASPVLTAAATGARPGIMNPQPPAKRANPWDDQTEEIAVGKPSPSSSSSSPGAGDFSTSWGTFGDRKRGRSTKPQTGARASASKPAAKFEVARKDDDPIFPVLVTSEAVPYKRKYRSDVGLWAPGRRRGRSEYGRDLPLGFVVCVRGAVGLDPRHDRGFPKKIFGNNCSQD